MRLILTFFAAVMGLSACEISGNEQTVSAPVTDPYVVGTNGTAIYRGNVNVPGSRLPGSQAGQTGVIDGQFASIGDTVYFAEAQTALSQESRDTLSRQAAWLVQHSAATAVIEGHADEPGTREFNLALGARRATSVREYLVLKGVNAGRIKTVSYGKERPASICSSEASCLARNRRAVTVVNQNQEGV